MTARTGPRPLGVLVLSGLLSGMLPGCLASRAELRSAVAAAEAERRDLAAQLAAMQELLVDLTIRQQAGELALQRIGGDVDGLSYELDAVAGRVARIGERLATPVRREAAAALPATAPVWETAAEALAAAEQRMAAAEATAAAVLLQWAAAVWPDPPTGTTIRLRAADALRLAGEPLAALDAYLALLETAREPETVAPAYLGLGDALAAIGERATARRSWQDLIRLYPQRPEAAQARLRLQGAASDATSAPTGPEAGSVPTVTAPTETAPEAATRSSESLAVPAPVPVPLQIVWPPAAGSEPAVPAAIEPVTAGTLPPLQPFSGSEGENGEARAAP